jgi:hypothetical protein
VKYIGENPMRWHFDELYASDQCVGAAVELLKNL